MARKLASIQEILEIRPIEGADAIEEAHVLGWVVVVAKSDNLKAGDKVVYFETDSLLPETNPVYESFQSRGQKTLQLEDGTEVRGHVLKTMKLRGVYSQGLILPLSAFDIPADTPIDTDVTDIVGIYKYEAPIPVDNGSVVGKFEEKWCPKTDAPRIQNLVSIYDTLRTLPVEVTVKVDGTSRTLLNDGESEDLRVFGRNWEISKEDTAFTWADKVGISDIIRQNPGMAVQLELVGENIQKNRLKLKGHRGFIFAVYQNGNKLPRSEWPELFLKWATPQIDFEFPETVEEAIEKINGLRGCVTKDVLDEGVVAHLIGDLPKELLRHQQLDRNKNFKIISNKFLEKHGL